MMKCVLKNRLLPFVLSFAFFSFILPPSSSGPSPLRQKTLLKTIIIDAGHGGMDPGAHGKFSTEAEVALTVAMKLGKAIQEAFPDVKVVYTRTTDVLPGNARNINDALRHRADMANEAKGDLFISVHCNAAGSYGKRVVRYKLEQKMVKKGKKTKKIKVTTPVYEKYFIPSETMGTETYIWAADRAGAKSQVTGHLFEGESDAVDGPDLNDPEFKAKSLLKYIFNFLLTTVYSSTTRQ